VKFYGEGSKLQPANQNGKLLSSSIMIPALPHAKTHPKTTDTYGKSFPFREKYRQTLKQNYLTIKQLQKWHLFYYFARILYPI
jgi:hypothetical protein